MTEAPGRPRVYGLVYESATTPGAAFSDMLTDKRHEGEPRILR